MEHNEKNSSYFRANDQFDNHLSDSGFKSNCYPDKRKTSDKPIVQKVEMPYMLSFVGGAFTIQLYKYSVNIQMTFTNPFHADVTHKCHFRR